MQQIKKKWTDRAKKKTYTLTRTWPLHLNRQFHFDAANMIIIEYLSNSIIVMSLVKLIFCNDICVLLFFLSRYFVFLAGVAAAIV